MGIVSIVNQPANSSLNAAYRPVILSVNAQGLVITSLYEILFATSTSNLQISPIPTTAISIGDTVSINNPSITGTYNITDVVIDAINNILTLTTDFTPITLGPDYHQLNATIKINGTVASNSTVTNVPPVVYCDVYNNGIFYKTLSKTQYTTLNNNDSTWVFDIQDICQEVLKKTIGINGDKNIEITSNIMNSMYCCFRSSSFDIDGLLQQDTIIPIQSTSSSPAVAGTGMQSNTFFIVNSTLQFSSFQDLATHLNVFKNLTWSSNAWPLTHRQNGYQISVNNSDFFPIIYVGDSPLSCIKLFYKYRGQSTWNTLTQCGLLSNSIWVLNLRRECTALISITIDGVGIDMNNLSIIRIGSIQYQGSFLGPANRSSTIVIKTTGTLTTTDDCTITSQGNTNSPSLSFDGTNKVFTFSNIQLGGSTTIDYLSSGC